MLKNLPKAIKCSRKREEGWEKMIAFFSSRHRPLARRSTCIMLSAAQNNLNDDTKSALGELHLDHEQDLVVTCDM